MMAIAAGFSEFSVASHLVWVEVGRNRRLSNILCRHALNPRTQHFGHVTPECISAVKGAAYRHIASRFPTRQQPKILLSTPTFSASSASVADACSLATLSSVVPEAEVVEAEEELGSFSAERTTIAPAITKRPGPSNPRNTGGQ